MSNAQFSEETESLKSILERLDYCAIEALREFIENGDVIYKEREKSIHRARRALDRVIAELTSLDQMEA